MSKYTLFWKAILSLALFLASSCGSGRNNAASKTKIIGGKEDDAPPYFVLLHYKDNPTPFCGGTLIEKNLVLTAAHCASGASMPIEVWLGVKSLSHLPASTEVEAIEVHPQYNKNSIQYDLALLHLASHEGSNSYSTIPYQENDHKFESLRVFGYGSLSSSEPRFPDRIHSVSVDVLPNYECESLGGPYGHVFENELCAGDMAEGERDSCFGDSGGPLVTEEKIPRLYGIVSWGVGCGSRGRPGVYTRVKSFAPWIEKHKSTIEDRSFDEFVGSAFYFPLNYSERGIGGEKKVLRFSAAYGLWKEVENSFGTTLETWTKSVGSKLLEIDLIALNRGQFRLRARFGAKTYETAVHYSLL
ncbi:MAG: serine protease [Oligoflexus sp.]|nr:serine protease [Oligoflexus sp.]